MVQHLLDVSYAGYLGISGKENDFMQQMEILKSVVDAGYAEKQFIMTKHQTKAQKFNDLANAIGQIRKGEKVKRIGAKDGSIATHPVVHIDYPGPEKRVLGDCLYWLKKHHVFCNRHDAGTFQNDRGQWATYGIKGAGDIIGMLKDGQHFEIECKHGRGGRLSVGQQDRMKGVRDNGGLYFVVHGIEEIEYYLGVNV